MKLFCVILAVGALPAGAIEKPAYKVLESEKKRKLELRHYDAIPVASAPMGGMKNQNGSFGKLFRYISGANEKEEKIAMTSPVFMHPTPKDAGKAESGKMSFMIPAGVAKDGAPEPAGEGVVLDTIPAGKVAAIRFKGHRSEERRQAAKETLTAWVREQGWKTEGKPFFAYYNPPWTPGFLRRNEVWIRIK